MEILATIPVYTHPWIYTFLLAAAIVTIAGGIIAALMSIEVQSFTLSLVGLVLIIVGIVGVVHTNNAIKRTSVFDYNEYKVTIDETVNAQEFLTKYEILSREGKIFTIKEIEVDEE